MTSRGSFLNVSDQLVAAPGPGHYDPKLAVESTKVCVLNLLDNSSTCIKMAYLFHVK